MSDMTYNTSGPYITFYAVIFLRQWHLVALTPTLSCLSSAWDGQSRVALYAAFSGVLTLLRQINEDAGRNLESPPTLPHLMRTFPYVSEVRMYGASSGSVRFQITRRHPHVSDHRQVYIATTQDENHEIIVKFAQQYSIALHAFCAQRGHAPEVLGFEEKPGHWFVVAMEYISPVTYPSKSPNLHDTLENWAADLQSLMQAFHDEDMVHGDLREPNIVCDGEKVYLLDFDWGGRVGEAQYPHAQLNDELIVGRESRDNLITKGDDVRILNNTLRLLESL